MNIAELALSFLSLLGLNGILLFFIKRYFDKRDRREQLEKEKRDELYQKVDISLETVRLLAYARVSEETERLLIQGYATPSERRFLKELYDNYKAHGWNGDMDDRLNKVYSMRTDRKSTEED